MIVQSLDRPTTPSFRIYRRLRNGALRPVPFWGGDVFSLHAVDAETAVENARALGITGELVAVEDRS